MTMRETNSSSNDVHVVDLSTVSKNHLNPLGAPVRDYILKELDAARSNPNIHSVILTGGLRNFSAGADLTEFGSIRDSLGSSDNSSNKTLIDVVDALEGFSKPVIAAIAGNALGGGLELALACHVRIGTTTAKLGLPEVQVGVIPGAGGTQRLPRLIGLAKATAMILSGKPASASEAYADGLLDDVVASPTHLLPTAMRYAQQQSPYAAISLDDRRLGRRKISETSAQATNILEQAAQSIPAPEKGGFVQHCALEALKAAATVPSFAQGMQVEGEQFLAALTSLQGQARRHAFFAVRQAQKPVANLPKSVTQQHPLLFKSSSTKKIIQTAVIGAGTMGGGIALVLLQAGYHVTLVDINGDALKKGLATIHTIVQKSFVERKKLSQKHAALLLKRLSSSQDLKSLTNVQLVVEAVVERMDIKQQLFQTLDQVTPPSCILLSNTSTLDIDQMATALSPSRRKTFAGWHFFSPAHVMPLVEIVRGKDTSVETVVLLQALTKLIRKLGVVVGNCDGFCGNRMLKPYGRESGLLLVEGAAATPQQVDQALTGPLLGMSMGVFAMGDLAGNDVEYHIRSQRGWTRDPKTNQVPPGRPPRYTELADDLVTQLGRLGQKSSKGWYDYDPKVGKGREPIPSKEVEQFIQRYVSKDSAQRSSPLSDMKIIERILFPLVNEGFKCLEEGIAQCPSDIDVVYLNGYGWPLWRGGPMFWADHEIGLPRLLRTLQRLAKEFPSTDHYVPSKLLFQCVQLDVTVEEYYAKGMHRRQRNPSRL